MIKIFTQAELQAMKQKPSSVPCNGCTACCKNDTIYLLDEEADKYNWHYEYRSKVLDRKPDGSCQYLTATGCSVHNDPPDLCKRFDCRVLFLTTDKTARRIRIQQNPSMKAVYAAGKKRIETLKEKV